jgi:DNA-binding GntR family transcriptional regulator
VDSANTKADDIALILEEAIVSGQLEPGTVLRQEQLSEQFAVSRTPVREALRRLAALGLVSFEPNRGVRVRLLSREELREAFLVRAELESLATELAVPNMTAEDLDALDAAEERFSKLTLDLRRKTRAGDHDTALIAEWARANHAFHDVIYAAADSPFVERLAKSARRTFLGKTKWAAGLDMDDLYEKNDLQHKAIRAAIAAGSASGARALAREHVLSSGYLQEVVLDHVAAQARVRRRSA